jgi:UDP-GlcNAc:undecaprenyl-phosphate GlcNAc-1-phosphate transferase
MTADERVILLGEGAFVTAALLVPVVRRFAVAWGITDHPAPRKIHAIPTPYLGGLAIAAAAVLAAAAAPGWGTDAALVLGGALVVATAGLVDDIRTVRPATRVLIEVCAATAAFSAGWRVRLVNDPVDLALTVVWIVLVTNAFNLLDNMDGAMATVGAVIGAALAVAGMLDGDWFAATVAAAVAGACTGFLVHNWHPASIFMGDAGALFVGFLVAALALGVGPVDDPSGAVVAVLLVAPVLFDTTLVVLSRWRAHRPVFAGGTDHTSHRLLQQGLSPAAVCVMLASAAVVTAVLGVAVAQGAMSAWIPASAVGPTAFVALVVLLRAPVYEPGTTRVWARRREAIPVAD